MNHIQFRPSACGRFIVSLIGSGAPRVLTTDEADALRTLYRDKQREFLTNGHPLGALISDHEKVVADLLDAALVEAGELTAAHARARRL